MKPVTGSLLLLLSVSCTLTGSGDKPLQIPLPEKGVIHEKISCPADTSISYALYLPMKKAQDASSQAPGKTPSPKGSRMAENKLFPVMIVFDPHGDGVLPLKLYKDLAEKFGFILVGSINSKNGLPASEVKKIVGSLMHEVRSAYPVDTNRIYFLGFSGGARVAGMAALHQVPVKGVIGCGAGFGNGGEPVRYKFDYFGIAGTADFNMTEMLQLDDPLTKAGFRHCITTFPGIHAWPPAQMMEDAFIWITLNAMKDGMLKVDQTFVAECNDEFSQRVDSLKTNNHLPAAAGACRVAISFTNGLAPVDKFQEELRALEKSADYQFQVNHRLKIQKQEKEEKQKLMQALQAEDLAWWKRRINRDTLHVTGTEKSDPEDTLKERRLMSFLSLFCYMNANAALAQRDEHAAIKIVAIYEMADKTNPEPNYMRAILLARRSESESAIAQLQIAVKKGFSDKQRITSQSEFTSMNNLPAWNELMKRLK